MAFLLSASQSSGFTEGLPTSFEGDGPSTMEASGFSSVEGFYKDVFMDSAYRLTSRKSLPAAGGLGLTLEYVAVGDADSDKATQNRLLVSYPGWDDNGILLYPDGAPRFRMIYVNGGASTSHGSSLGETGRQRFRDYFQNGGSYSGSCAGAFIAALHYNHNMYIRGPDNQEGTSDDYTPLKSYFHIWPGTMDASTLSSKSPDLEASSGMGDHPFWHMFPSLQDGLVKDCYFNLGPKAMRDDYGDLAEMAKTEFLARYNIPEESSLHLNAGLLAYKRDELTGRLVIIGCHPEGSTSGEKLDLMKAILSYALQGVGEPRAKAALVSGEPRLMNDNKKTGFEKLGDKQYHHFTIEIPDGTTRLEVTLDGTDGYDFDLFLRRGDYAFRSQSDYDSRSPQADEYIIVNDPTPGIWYVGVNLYSSVTYNKDDYNNYYTGKTEVLNGIAYSIRAEWGSEKPTFADVPFSHPYHDEIEALYQAGYTAGCQTEPLSFCPDQAMTRAEGAVFVERGVHGVDVAPPNPVDSIFADMDLGYWGLKWATALWEDGYTAGCAVEPLAYCPEWGHSRAEGAVFYLRILHGADYEPPVAAGIFADVAVGAWYAKWAEAAYGAGLIPACAEAPLRFCPDDPLTRGLAAYMMVQAKGMSMP